MACKRSPVRLRYSPQAPIPKGVGAFLFTEMFYCYVIYSERIDRYYIGSTEDIGRRLNDHNTGRNPSTKQKGPWVLKWSKEFPTRAEAMVEEKRLKSRKSRTFLEQLIARG